MFSNFFSENRALYENVRKYCGTAKAQLTIWRLCLSYWISKATNTHSQYVMFIFFPYDNVCTDVPRCYVILMCIASLFSASYWGSSQFKSRTHMPANKCSFLVFFIFFSRAGQYLKICHIIFIVAPCILKIHRVLYTNKCTNCTSYISLKLFTLKHFHCSYMFR